MKRDRESRPVQLQLFDDLEPQSGRQETKQRWRQQVPWPASHTASDPPAREADCLRLPQNLLLGGYGVRRVLHTAGRVVVFEDNFGMVYYYRENEDGSFWLELVKA